MTAHRDTPPRIDSSGIWQADGSPDIAETLLAKGAARAAAPSIQINTVQGDVINLGAMSPQALSEFLAAKRKQR